MRLLRLELQAFGAYAGHVELDFSALAPDALFLIHGPTGGGKTTILDAICFALFDEASAESERTRRGLRSDHAPPEADTWVELDMAIGEARFRLRRSPEFERAAKRGTGLARQAAKVALYRLEDGREGELLASKAGEVSDRVKSLLGMDVGQFRQTALLPQGQFRRLLSASSAEREKIMKELFGTEALAALQDLMKRRVAELRQKIETLGQRRAQEFEACECPDEAVIGGLILSLGAAIEARAGEIDKAKETRDQAARRLNDAREVNRALERLQKARNAVAEVEAGKAALVELEEQLARARKARSLDALWQGCNLAKKRSKDTRAKADVLDLRHADARIRLEKCEERKLELFRQAGGVRHQLAGVAETAARQGDEVVAELAGLERRWREGRAAQLAATLEPGGPCPVCGSKEHPAPAVSDGLLPDDAAIDQARDEVQRQQGVAERAGRASEAFEAGLRSLELLDSCPPALLPAAPSPEAWHERWRRHADDFRAISEEITDLAAKKEAAHLAAAEAADALAESDKALDAAILDMGFEGRTAYADARRDDRWIDARSKEVARHDKRAIEATAELRLAEEQAQGHQAAMDLAPLEAASVEAGRKHETLIRDDASEQARRQSLMKARGRLEDIARELGKLSERERVEGHIADLANGKGGGARITFQRFVLAALLDEALDAASQRLRAMSRGRYDLRRITATGRRNQSDGLEIEIDDAYTGRARPAQSLSGGESFQAALALALGMMDVVRRHAGGIRLDVMFIDEGFGSLDPEALELAMRTLVDLRKDGRMIGIVSHVPELREWVDVRLEVTANRTGSSARLVLP